MHVSEYVELRSTKKLLPKRPIQFANLTTWLEYIVGRDLIN